MKCLACGLVGWIAGPENVAAVAGVVVVGVEAGVGVVAVAPGDGLKSPPSRPCRELGT